jgi:DNA-3-methyladenine glycosylase
VEVEAYLDETDRASHARSGRTPRNAPMYGPPGHAYLYLVYGMHRCLNVVTEPAGRPAAVLIRAVQPLAGLDDMRASLLASSAGRRVLDRALAARRRDRLAALPDARLASGPGLVGAAFGLELAMSGIDLLDPASPLRLESGPPGTSPPRIEATPRVGVGYAGLPWSTVPWRFCIAGHPSLSGRRRRPGQPYKAGGVAP